VFHKTFERCRYVTLTIPKMVHNAYLPLTVLTLKTNNRVNKCKDRKIVLA